MNDFGIGLLAFYAVVSVVAFFFYGADKKKAIKHRMRIPEATLLGLGFFGGAVGALAGMSLFRHKTKHWYFWVVNYLGLAVQAALALLVFGVLPL